MDEEEDDKFQAEEIRHFIYVAQPLGKKMYAIQTSYWETDAMHAVGQVWRFVKGGPGEYSAKTVVNTDDGLTNVWASPGGNAWVGSAWGRVYTTADVPWDQAKFTEVSVKQTDPDAQWKGTDLPHSPLGGSYDIHCMTGSSDRDVHVGTFTGHILHWNGADWRISFTENSSSLQRMHGTSATNQWAVGRDGTVLHYDGHHWRRVPLPGDATTGENLTGVWAVSDDEVYICSTSGAIFHGSRHGLERLGEYPYTFYGIVEFEGKFFLAGGDKGVCTLEGNVVSVVKGNFAATGVYRLDGRLAFVEPIQKAPGRIIFYEPTDPKPWRVC